MRWLRSNNSVSTLIGFGVVFQSVRMLVGAYGVLFLLSRGLPVEDIAIIKGIQAGILLLFSIPFSYLADKYGHKKLMYFSLMSSSLWLACTAYSPSVAWLYLGEILNALSMALYNGPFEAFLINTHKKRNPGAPVREVLGRYSKYSFIAMALAVLIGSLAPSTDSTIFWWIGCICLTVQCLLTGFLLKNTDFNHNTADPNDHRPIGNMRQHVGVVLKTIKNNKVIAPYMALAILVNFYYQVSVQYWQPLSFELLNESKNTALYSAIFILILLVQSASGKSIEQAKSIRGISILLVIGLTSTCALTAFLQQQKFSIGVLFIIFSFYLIKLLQIISSSEVNELIPAQQRTTFMAAISTFMRLVLFPMFFLISFAISKMGSYAVYLTGLSLFFCIPSLSKLTRKEIVRKEI